MGGTLVVAALGARPLAESARRAGWRVVALDLFGDVDTRRASACWWRIGEPAAFAIDPVLLREGLLRAACEPGAVGWVAGSGFEAMPELLDFAVPGLPLLGMGATAVRRVRDPVCFFDTLDRLGLAHPEVALHAPASLQRWLVKSATGFGGWHVRPAGEHDPAAGGGVYWQQLQAGESMSALFLADGSRARLVGLNRQIVRPLGTLPFVFHGAIGPIRDAALVPQVEHALALLVPAFGLRGLASLDFLAHEGRLRLLEVNPRPSATMVLYDDAWPGGLVRAHVRAVAGELPGTPASLAQGLRGELVVYAQRACRVAAALAEALAAAPDCHDLPAAGTRFDQGEPVCSVSAAGAHVEAVLAALEARAAEVRERLSPVEELAA